MRLYALMAEFKNSEPTFAILKHTNACGVATRRNCPCRHGKMHLPLIRFLRLVAYSSATRPIDEETAKEIDELFYEVLIAPSFTEKP